MFLEPFVTKTIQSQTSSAPQKRATARLAKSRTSSHVFSKTDLSHPPGDSNPDTSQIAPLPGQHSSETRHMIRREISGGFGDMLQHGSEQSHGSRDISFQSGSPWNVSSPQLGQTLNPARSSLTLNGQSHGQVPPVPEHQLDVGQAISLLQELKKTATPDELVALHRALLPTREVLVAQSPPLAGQNDVPLPPRVMRRRTVIPPGLATRAGFDGDLLRRPEEASALEKLAAKQRRVSGQQEIEIPKRNLAALSLADDTSSMAGTHIFSPAESAFTHTGMYRHGTLWVTNRSATPEPSIISGMTSRTKAVETPVHLGPEANAELRGDSDESDEQGVVHHSPDNYSQHRNVQKSLEATRFPPIQESNHETRRHKRHHTLPNPDGKQGTQTASTQHKQHYQSVAKNAIIPAKWADGPNSVPQVDHSPTHLSAGHNVDYETISNHSEGRALPDPRVSQEVFANEEGDDSVPHRDSLKGVDRADAINPRTSGPTELPEISRAEAIITYDTRIFPGTFDDRRNSRPETLHHPDSGYGSDATSYNARNRRSKEGVPLDASPIKISPNPHLRDGLDTPTDSPTSAKKLSPFARIKSMTASKSRNLPSLDSEYPLSCDANAIQEPISPIEPRTSDHAHRGTRKLQKPMPKAVLKQREAKLQMSRHSVIERSQEDSFNHDPQNLPTGLNIANSDESAGLAIANATRDEDGLIAQPDAGLSEDRGRRSTKPTQDHQRQRSKTVHGPRENVVLEPEKALGVSRMRSKSLGRNVGRSRERPAHDWQLTLPGNDDINRAEHLHRDHPSDHPSTSKKETVSEILSKRRSVPTLQFFQHQRQYQIQPGSVMPKPGVFAGEEAGSVRPQHQGEKPSKRGLPPVEKPPRQDHRVEGLESGGSKEFSAPKSTRPTPSFEDTASRTELPFPRREAHQRPFSLQIGNTTAHQQPSGYESGYATKTDPVLSDTRHFGAQKSLPMAGRRDHDSYGYSDHHLMEHSGHEPDTHPTSNTYHNRQGWSRPEVEERGHGSAFPGYADTYQQSSQPSVTKHHRNASHDARHTGWPGWERQAQLWRERRENAGANLFTQMEYASGGQIEPPIPPAHSPRPETQAIPASHQPRAPYDDHYYHNDLSPRPGGTAVEQANAYQNFVMGTRENRPAKADVPRTDSAQSTATFYTVRTSYEHPPAARPSGPRPQSALSYTQPSDPAAPPPWNSPRETEQTYFRTNSGQYIPYRPDNPTQPEPPRPEPMPHGKRPARPNSHAQYQPGNLEAVCDRFGGGLGFGWDRAAGMKGSAGFRANPAHGPPAAGKEGPGRGPSPVGRKYGIDLSDVPLFLQKV